MMEQHYKRKEVVMKRAFCIRLVTVFFLLLFVSLNISDVAAATLPLTGEEVKLIANDAVSGAEFGRSVAIDGDLAAVGAGGATAGPIDHAGAVYLFKRQGQTYVLEAKLVAPDASEGAEFGRAVAIHGNMVIVGARFAEVEVEPGNILSKAGAAYVFRKDKGAWQFDEKITSPTPADEDNFGRALAIQGDLLVITARKENLGDDDVGAAYVFLYQNGKWINQQKLTAGSPTPGAYFGQSVAVQGDRLAIGARNAGPGEAGAVYLFRRSGNDWMEFAKATPPDGAADDQFAFTVAMVGNVMAVGARRADLNDAKDAGAAYVYTLDRDSVELVAKLTASGAKQGDQFGQSIAMAGDVIAVGANRAKIGNNTKQGAIYLFRRMGNEWIEMEKATASDGMTDDEFGYSLSAFGNDMVTGAHFANSNEGAAYVIPLKP